MPSFVKSVRQFSCCNIWYDGLADKQIKPTRAFRNAFQLIFEEPNILKNIKCTK